MQLSADIGRTLWTAAALAAVTSTTGVGCRRDDDGRQARRPPVRTVAPEPGRPGLPDALAGWDELAFIPREVEAVARVDLARMAASDPGFAALLPSTLARHRPELMALLAAGGVDLVNQIERAYFALGKDFGRSGAYLFGFTGSFEHEKLHAALLRAKLEQREVFGLPLFALDTPEGRAGVLVVHGLFVAGALPLVERSAKLIADVGAAAPPHDDVRRSVLAEELAELDRDAHVVVAAVLGEATRAALGPEAEGLERLRLSSLRVRGRAQVTARMSFTSAALAVAARARLAALLAGAETSASSLGLLAQFLDPTLELELRDRTLSARAAF